MTSSARTRASVGEWLRIGSALLTAAALAAAVMSSVVLLLRYSPKLSIEDPSAGSGYEPRTWVALHEASLRIAVVAVLVWAGVTVVALVRERPPRSTAVAAIFTVTTVAACVVASLTWFLVRWDQLALWGVTVGHDFADTGLWEPAVSDQVRFLIIGGAEVGQSTYLRLLVVHVAAPLLALLGLAASWWAASPADDGPAAQEAPAETARRHSSHRQPR